MARKPTTVNPEPMAILEFNCDIVLPYDKASELFALACQGIAVKYDWSASAPKRVIDKNDLPKLRMFTVGELAELDMNSDVDVDA